MARANKQSTKNAALKSLAAQLPTITPHKGQPTGIWGLMGKYTQGACLLFKTTLKVSDYGYYTHVRLAQTEWSDVR